MKKINTSANVSIGRINFGEIEKLVNATSYTQVIVVLNEVVERVNKEGGENGK